MGSFLPLIFTTKVVQTIHTDHVHHHSRTGPGAESDVAEARFLLQRRWLNYWQFFWIVLYSLFTFQLTARIFSHYAYYLPSETRDKSSNQLPCDLNCPGGCKHAAFSCSGKTLVQYWSALSSIPHTHSPGYVLFLPTVPPQLALTWIPFLMGPCYGRMLNLQLSYALMCTFFMTFYLISWWSVTPHSFCPHRTQPTDCKQSLGHTELFAMWRSEMVWVSFLDKHFYCTTLTEISNYSHSTLALSAPL